MRIPQILDVRLELFRSLMERDSETTGTDSRCFGPSLGRKN